MKVGLGTDIAGGYSIDIMSAMRQAVMISRMREGARIMGDFVNHDAANSPLSIDWKEALYLATRGGAIALGLQKESGAFCVGAPFDAQLSTIQLLDCVYFFVDVSTTVKVFDPEIANGVGPLDFFDEISSIELTTDVVEKWWCIGDERNRQAIWIQGRKVIVT